jgi:hypothetical protein
LLLMMTMMMMMIITIIRNDKWNVQFMNLLIMQFSTSHCLSSRLGVLQLYELNVTRTKILQTAQLV